MDVVKDQIGLPPLAQYFKLSTYTPSYGDTVIWCGWFSTWIGVISNYDQHTDELYIIFSCVPAVLFTLDPSEQESNTRRIKLSKIKTSSPGAFAIQKHDYAKNTNIWYL